jgi:nicotinate-nucleotide pyrophosphorylase (carboxylating)
LYRRQLATLVNMALAEDVGSGDRTTRALDLTQRRTSSHLIAKSPGVLAGADAFALTFRALDRGARVEWAIREGKTFRPGVKVGIVRATPAALLSGERTAINFVAHLSGIATATRRLTDRMGSSRARLLDTRKTTPGWRFLEKRAALLGGAVNHRFGLFDALMIKSNHADAVGDFSEAVRRAAAGRKTRRLICEVRTMEEVQIALSLGVRWLLLDHFTFPRLHGAVNEIRRFERENGLRGDSRVVVEVSGNVTARAVSAIARCGVDYISSGAITHSAPACDFSLRWNRNESRS